MKQICSTGYAVIFILSLHTSFCAGQVRLIQGRITDSSTGRPVEYAHILNYSLQRQIYSNSNGEFQLRIRQGDTLVLYAIGYFYQKVIVEDSMLQMSPVTFTLKEQPYELSEARIVAGGTYDDFKRRFVKMDRPVTQTEELNSQMADIARSEAIEAYNMAKANEHLGGVTFLTVKILTPEEIERIKLGKIMEREQVQDQIYQKFNPMVVKQITGLLDDKEIIEFMVFCKFSDAYLLEVNEYDLASRIALKYELFQKRKEDEKLMKNPVNILELPDEVFS
jgi:hypothetical protein